MNRHTGGRPFKCEIYNKRFNQGGNLTMHTRIHTGEKTFKCDLCNKTMSRNGDLMKHMRIHTG